MDNTLTAAEIKRRGMAAIEESLARGPVHLIKHNKPTAVVLTQAEYLRLTSGQPSASPGMSAMQWLLTQAQPGRRSKAEIDATLAEERSW